MILLLYNNYLYGEKNAAGVPQKLHLLYSAEDKKWYLHDLVSNTLVEALIASGRNIYFNNSSKDSNISLRIYKDGEEYTDTNSIMTNWSIVDKKEKYTSKKEKKEERGPLVDLICSVFEDCGKKDVFMKAYDKGKKEMIKVTKELISEKPELKDTIIKNKLKLM